MCKEEGKRLHAALIGLDDITTICWLAPLPHSNKVLGLNPLTGQTLCLRGLSTGTLASSHCLHVQLIGVSKLAAGATVSVNDYPSVSRQTGDQPRVYPVSPSMLAAIGSGDPDR